MPTALVTGGAGFIGSHVSRLLCELGYRVLVLDDLSGGFERNVPSGAHFVQGSITDTALVEELFEVNQPDYVFHLAAYAAEGLSHFIRRFNYENNVLGSMNLINAAVKYEVKCFVFTSSIAVYGTKSGAVDEQMIPEPEDPYGIAKYAVELDLKAAQSQFGLNSIVFRPHNVYGPHQNIGDKYRNVVGIFMNQLLRGEPLRIFGDGQQTRAFTYVDDVAPILVQSIENTALYNQVFNIGSGEVHTVLELAKLVQEVMGIQQELSFEPQRNEVLHAYAVHKRLGEALGGMPVQTPLKAGLIEMAKWVKQYGSRSTSDFAGIEIEKHLPQSWKT